MKNQFSPAPWTWEDWKYDCGQACTPSGCMGHNNGIPTILRPVGISVEDYPEDIPLWIRDAKLIALAPEMLKTLQDLTLMCRAWQEDFSAMNRDSPDYDPNYKSEYNTETRSAIDLLQKIEEIK